MVCVCVWYLFVMCVSCVYIYVGYICGVCEVYMCGMCVCIYVGYVCSVGVYDVWCVCMCVLYICGVCSSMCCSTWN